MGPIRHEKYLGPASMATVAMAMKKSSEKVIRMLLAIRFGKVVRGGLTKDPRPLVSIATI